MEFVLAALINMLIIEPFIASNIGFFVYLLSSKRFEAMNAKECLNHSLRNKEHVFTTIGVIQNGIADWHVYGKDGVELPKQLHRYEIASITKTITGAIVARAVDEGKIHINDSIDQYLELPDKYQYPTVRELLTHTSGYKSFYIERDVFDTIGDTKNILSGINADMVLKRIEKLGNKRDHAEWHYSNFNFAVLGLVLESVYHKPYSKLVNDLLAEYGLIDSYISDGRGDLGNYLGWQKGDAYMAGGAVSSNIEDMLKYAQLQLDNVYPFYNSRDVLKEMQIKPELCAKRSAMCYGWMLDQENGFYWHNGQTPGYKTYIGICPDSQTAVVVLSNAKRTFGLRHLESNIGAKMLEDLQKTNSFCSAYAFCKQY